MASAGKPIFQVRLFAKIYNPPLASIQNKIYFVMLQKGTPSRSKYNSGRLLEKHGKQKRFQTIKSVA
jgi:hypothetical protein